MKPILLSVLLFSVLFSFAQNNECAVSDWDYVFMLGKLAERNAADLFAISDVQEMQIGRESSGQMIQKYTLASENDPRWKRVRVMVNRLASYRNRKSIYYTPYLIQDSTINAFSHAGGFVYFTTGLIDALQNEDELAFVIGHEMSHIDKRHCIRPIQLMMAASKYGEETGKLALEIFRSLTISFNQYDEYEADWAAAEWIKKAGYNPEKGMDVFRRWAKMEKPSETEKMFRTHPFSKERLCFLKEYIATNLAKE